MYTCMCVCVCVCVCVYIYVYIGAGAELLALLVQVAGLGGVRAGGCREQALGALVNMSMVKEARHAIYQSPALEGALIHVVKTEEAGSCALNLAMKALRNLSDQGGADNRCCYRVATVLCCYERPP